MLELNGKFASAKVFTDNIDNKTISQIINLCNQDFVDGCQIRIMPDTHAGMGCVIGFTANLEDKIIPNLIGVDIGCFTEDTKVQLCDNRQLTFKELIEESEKGIEHYGYSIDRNSNIRVSKLTYPRGIKTVDELIEVTLDNDEVIRCTADHIFYSRDNEEIKAKDLRIGQSLMPIYIEMSNEIKDKPLRDYRLEDTGHLAVYNPNSDEYTYIHQISDEYNMRNGIIRIPKEKSWVRHHRDFDKFNNNPTNIVREGFKEHWKLHYENVRESNKEGRTGFNRARELHPELFSKLGHDNMLKNFENEDFRNKNKITARNNLIKYNKSDKNKARAKEIGSKFFNERNSSEEMKNMQKLGRVKNIVNKCIEIYGEVTEENYEVVRRMFYNYPYYEKTIKFINKLGFKCIEDVINEDVIKKIVNHKVKNIRIIRKDNTDVYCLTCREFGNFALASGVFVHNCGMLTVDLQKGHIGMDLMDGVVNKYVPSGFDFHKVQQVEFKKLKELKCYRDLQNMDRIEKSIGTLGGGNHFLELDVDDEGRNYLVIHSGSRNLGKQVADIYQKLAIELRSGREEYYKKRDELIKEYKLKGNMSILYEVLNRFDKEYKLNTPEYPKELCFLTGEYKENYLHDMAICQEYASLNREVMANLILKGLGVTNLRNFEHFHTVHNYINLKDNIIRKGAISAYKNERVLIPMNMRDGSLLCVGKGNADWNYSAPHGAGRIMSRSKAKELINLADYEETMKGIYSTSVKQSTIDEAPQAYKPMKEIIDNIADTVDILKVIKPIYNFKASE